MLSAENDIKEQEEEAKKGKQEAENGKTAAGMHWLNEHSKGEVSCLGRMI